MGLFAYLLHIDARGIDDLTVDEFDTYCDWIDRHQADAAKGASSG